MLVEPPHVTVTWPLDMGSGVVAGDGAGMSFDIDRPPAEPPDDCRHRLLWRVARALWEAHRPDSAGFCVVSACRREHHLYPCPAAVLAVDGLNAACGVDAPSSTSWLDVVRRKVAAGQIDPVDAMAEVLWHHHQRRSAGR